MKVYLVTVGSYSDYSVRAVFADRELAKAHRAELSDSNEIEEYELLTDRPTRMLVYSMSNDTYHGRGVPHEWSYDAWSYDAYYKRAEVTKYRQRDGTTSVRVVGLDQEAVRKSFTDALMRAEAEAQGLA